MDLSERKLRILQAIVDDYIVSGMPIGSRTISRMWGGRYSPATIRNEMSDSSSFSLPMEIWICICWAWLSIS